MQSKPGTAMPGAKTMNHFYTSAKQMEDLSKRPGSASTLPKPRIVRIQVLIEIEKCFCEKLEEMKSHK